MAKKYQKQTQESKYAFRKIYARQITDRVNIFI